MSDPFLKAAASGMKRARILFGKKKTKKNTKIAKKTSNWVTEYSLTKFTTPFDGVKHPLQWKLSSKVHF